MFRLFAGHSTTVLEADSAEESAGSSGFSDRDEHAESADERLAGKRVPPHAAESPKRKKKLALGVEELERLALQAAAD